MKLPSFLILLLLGVGFAAAGSPSRFLTWTVTYGTIHPFPSLQPQQGILINGQFPGPQINCTTNDNLIINVINNLDEPFLITWNGILQKKNSWQDGVLGTNCPIPPNSNFTYQFQAKDQIGSYTYFPSTAMHRAAGGYGALNVYQRPMIPIPYDPPAGDFTLLVGDWFYAGHKALKQTLDSGNAIGSPDGLVINGLNYSTSFSGDQGKTYLFRVSNVGLKTTVNFRIQNHTLKLVEVEGSHTIQNIYDSLDIHVGQSATVLVTLNQSPKDYYIVVSSRFLKNEMISTSVLHYKTSSTPVSGPVPPGPASGYDWSMKQANTIRWNLTASQGRPNPQGSFHYGTVPINRTLVFANSAPMMNGKQRYAVNGVSFVVPDTPLKLADSLNIPGVFTMDTIPTNGTNISANVLGTPALNLGMNTFVEIVFQNTEDTMQSWHLDGFQFWVVAYGYGQWSEQMRGTYNLFDAVARHTVEVYPNAWSAILVSLGNQGMWNMRSAMWARQYLGQQFYVRIWTNEKKYENPMPTNALKCGKAVGHS